MKKEPWHIQMIKEKLDHVNSGGRIVFNFRRNHSKSWFQQELRKALIKKRGLENG